MPLSPPTSNNGEPLMQGFHHLLQHNSNTSYPEQYDHGEGGRLHSNYGSPIPSQGRPGSAGPRNGYQYTQQYLEPGHGMPYDNADMFAYQDQYSTPATSPPTSSMGGHDTIRTRSGLIQQRPNQHLRPKNEARSKTEKSPKPKRAKKDKVKTVKNVPLVPLSELTKDFEHNPMEDIEAYVNRSAEVRRKEVDEGKQPGRVKRPMNSFMLYRKCYQHRAKEIALNHNHQVVSSMCGEHWPIEPDHVKEKFNEWARVERINHHNAHPGYKFSPSKPGAAKGAKRKSPGVDEELDLPEYDWQDRQVKKVRSSPLAQSQNRPVAYPPRGSAYRYSQSRDGSMEPNYAERPMHQNPSHFNMSNPHMQAPPQYNQMLQGGEYYEQTIRPNPNYDFGNYCSAEDVLLKKTAAPGVHSFLGLPGGSSELDIMNGMMPQHQQFDGMPVGVGPDQKIDPSLISSQGALHDNPEGIYFGDTQFEDQKFIPYGAGLIDPSLGDPVMAFSDAEPNQEGMPLHDPHMGILKGHQEGWHVESMDGGPEFDKWMDGE
ncbi:hypothetical protein HYFRA_00002943 [Hymenoscyphus fraxineus]|uniref:HMG box domain-containing protein n=1 Tax=Hymenoscyphus fraxineus TaxID=746836 RepID=A0A9N9KRI9_9HELO|nr:hypothetical protein HYFRA_00002943 [Hymenoscyphus fraxineus]